MKKNKGLIILIIFLILFMSSSFAWLNITIKGEKINILKAGDLSLILDETSSEGINIEEAVPVSDEKGLSQEGYTFKLVNNGTVTANYTITLDDLEIGTSEERMKDEVLKYNLTKNGVEGSTVFLPSIKVNNKRVVDSGTIEANTTNTYTLKMWIDYDTTNEAMNKIFAAKLNIDVEQENIKVEKSDKTIDINNKAETLGLEEDISNYIVESSDEEVAVIDSLGNIIGKHYGIAVFKIQNKKTGAKKEISVTITKKVEATFEKQIGIKKIGKETESCTLKEKEETSCSIALPEVEIEEGYTFVGFSKEKESHTGTTSRIDISEDTRIYTIVKKKEKTLTATFEKPKIGVKTIKNTTLSCTIPSVYNNEKQEESCKIVLPEVEVEEGYTFVGWNTSKEATTGVLPKTEIELTSNTTYYGIVKKDAITLSAKFYKNGVTSQDGSEEEYIIKTCKIEEKYNGEIQEKECSITTPDVVASTETPIIEGYSEEKDSTIGTIKTKTEIKISSNKTYYAITKSNPRTLTVTFYRNGAKTIDGVKEDFVTKKCNILGTYNGKKQEESCRIISPIIEASEETPIVLGYSEQKDDHTAILNSNEEKNISQDVSYYAQTKKESKTLKATYKVGTNVISIEKESNTCTIEEVYNGKIQEESCSVEGPTIIAKEGYTSVGYSNTDKDISGNTILELTKDTTFYANAVANSYTVEYYSGQTKLGESGVKVDEELTLPTIKSLNGEKEGYTFKGWTTKEGSVQVEYKEGEKVNNLSTTEKAVVKLYAVYEDDIKPVCKFSSTKEIYVGEEDTLEVTCTDIGSKLQKTNLGNNNFEVSNDSGSIISVSSPMEIENGYKYKVVIKGIKAGESQNTNGSFKVSLKENSILDNIGNGNKEEESEEEKVKGLTYSQNYTKEEGVESITATKTSCTTILDNLTCDVTLPGITAKEGYSKDGWYKNEEKIGNENTVYTLTKKNDGQTIIAKAKISTYTVEYNFNILNDMRKWEYLYGERFNNSYEAETNLTDIKMTGADGWEIVYFLMNTEVGKKYEISFDYQVPNGYTPLSGYKGVGYQILNSSPISNNDNSSSQIAIGYIPTEKTTNTEQATIEFTATTTTTYIAFNFGMANDNETTEIKIGNFAIKEKYEYNSQIELNKLGDVEGYTFIGWNTDKNAKEGLKTLKMGSSNLTLYAIFVKTTYEFDYTGSEQVFTVPVSGTYKLETWGAQGGGESLSSKGGNGAYTSGEILLKKDLSLYLYVGEKGKTSTKNYYNFNNGSESAYINSSYGIGWMASGGGATDIRLTSGNWSDFASLKTRIMVAAAGGGGVSYYHEDIGGAGGGLLGYNGTSIGYDGTFGSGATQTSGGSNGGGTHTTTCSTRNTSFGITNMYGCLTSKGGNGYYSGGAGPHGAGTTGSGGGGSSFISGHNGCDAISKESTESNIIHTGQSVHYSGYKFTNTVMVDGAGYNWTTKKGEYTGMPSYDGKSIMTGNEGNGYAKITLISVD